MSDRLVTPKKVALAILDKVKEVLKKSELMKSENNAAPSYEPEPHTDGKYSMEAAPEHPEASKHPHDGKTSKDGNCPEPVRPSVENGEGNTIRRTNEQENWQEKSEDITKSEKIRGMQKDGLSPNQIEANLKKDELSKTTDAGIGRGMTAGGAGMGRRGMMGGMMGGGMMGGGMGMMGLSEKMGKSELETDLENLEVLLKGENSLEKKYEGFKAVEASAAKSGASDPGAVAAAIGRKKYGKEAFQHAAAEGHKMKKGETENSKKLGYKLSDEGKEEKAPEASDHAFDTKNVKAKSSDDARQGSTPNPEKNPKEQAEGNNELAGTTPTQVGQDGKNIPGGDEIKGHLKLAKFLGMKGYKRKKALESSQHQTESSAQHAESIRNK
jgi:hypothetical protein